MVEEKRRYIRWRKKIRVAFSLAEKDDFFEEAFTEDLSELGLQILIDDKLQLKQRVRLKLEFVYDSLPIMAGAEVVYVAAYENQYRVGLEFIDLEGFQKQRLKRDLDKARQELNGEDEQGYARQAD